MNKQAALALLDELQTELNEARRLISGDVFVRVRDGFVGHPRSPSFEAGSGHRPPEDLADDLRGDLDYSDPVGRAVAESNGYDRAAVDARRMVGNLKDAVRQMRLFVSTGSRYQPRKANPIEQQEDTSEQGCESCARVDSPGTVGLPKTMRSPWWNPVFAEPTLPDGRVVAVCRWCWETPEGVKATGDLPSVDNVTSYRDTGRARKRSA